MKEIGGYFDFECYTKKHYHCNALRLNSARYAIEYILKVREIQKIYIPYYVCDSVINMIKKNNIEVQFYNISESFMPVFNKQLNNKEVILIVNYFGLLTDIIPKLSRKFKNVIIDNTQAFFVKPINEIDTVYSARKFVGVSDGGYLYTNCKKNLKIEQDISYDRYMYILKRSDLNAESGYQDFIANEELLNKEHMKKMSNLTSKILESLDYEYMKNKRKFNFNILDNAFRRVNKIKIPSSLKDNGPMVYPLLIEEDIREKLIENKIFVATYWKEVLNKVEKTSFEYYITNKLVPLPIDQRYDQDDMLHIINVVNKYKKM